MLVGPIINADHICNLIVRYLIQDYVEIHDCQESYILTSLLISVTYSNYMTEPSHYWSFIPNALTTNSHKRCTCNSLGPHMHAKN